MIKNRAFRRHSDAWLCRADMHRAASARCSPRFFAPEMRRPHCARSRRHLELPVAHCALLISRANTTGAQCTSSIFGPNARVVQCAESIFEAPTNDAQCTRAISKARAGSAQCALPICFANSNEALTSRANRDRRNAPRRQHYQRWEPFRCPVSRAAHWFAIPSEVKRLMGPAFHPCWLCGVMAASRQGAWKGSPPWSLHGRTGLLRRKRVWIYAATRIPPPNLSRLELFN